MNYGTTLLMNVGFIVPDSFFGIIFSMGTAPAQQLAILFDIAAILDPVPAGLALDSFQGASRHVLLGDGNCYLVHGEELLLGHDPVGVQLPRVFVVDFRAIFFREFPGLFTSHNPHRAARVKVDKGGGHDPVINPAHGSLSQAASGDGLDGVGGAAIDLDQDVELLPIQSLGVLNADCLQADHGHTHPDHLTGADMTMNLG